MNAAVFAQAASSEPNFRACPLLSFVNLGLRQMCVMFSDLRAKSPSERQCVPVRTDVPDPASSFNWPRPPQRQWGHTHLFPFWTVFLLLDELFRLVSAWDIFRKFKFNLLIYEFVRNACFRISISMERKLFLYALKINFIYA